MKAAIYIEQGVTQIVLTPENEWEKNALKMIAESSGQESQTYWDKFYECRGGWYRHGQATSDYGYGTSVNDGSSLIFRINKKTEVHNLPDMSA